MSSGLKATCWCWHVKNWMKIEMNSFISIFLYSFAMVRGAHRSFHARMERSVENWKNQFEFIKVVVCNFSCEICIDISPIAVDGNRKISIRHKISSVAQWRQNESIVYACRIMMRQKLVLRRTHFAKFINIWCQRKSSGTSRATEKSHSTQFYSLNFTLHESIGFWCRYHCQNIVYQFWWPHTIQPPTLASVAVKRKVDEFGQWIIWSLVCGCVNPFYL